MLALTGLAGAARAHAVVTGTEPADGAVLEAPPSEIVVRFNEPVSLVRAQVLDPAGADVLDPEGAQAGDGRLHLTLPADLTEGTYTVSYHVVSLDGHPVAGSLVFSMGRVSGGALAAAGDRTEVWRWLFVAAQNLLYLGLFGAAGGVAYALVVRPMGAAGAAARRLAMRSALLGIIAALLALGLQGGLLLGGPLSLLGEPGTWAAGIGSTFGRTALCAFLGLTLIGLGSRARPSAGPGALALLGAVLALASFALSGHVVTAGPRALTTPPLLLHATVAAFWAGSLLPLLRALDAPAEGAAVVLSRFSRLAVWAVPVLILAGLVLAWWQVRTPEALLTTTYGRVFVLKLVLVVGLLGLAALNRLRLTPALAGGDARAARWLRRSIGAEVGLVVAILAATAALGTTPPPRALVAAPLGAPDRHAHAEHGHSQEGVTLRMAGRGIEAILTLAPGQVGANVATITLQDAGGQPLEPLEVTLRLANPGRGVAPLERPAERDGAGWRVPDLVLGVPGTWEAELDVLVSDFEREMMRAMLEVQ